MRSVLRKPNRLPPLKESESVQGATRRKESMAPMSVDFHLSLTGWLRNHVQEAMISLGKLLHEPLGHLLTIAVIGIALSLPMGLYLLVDAAKSVHTGLEFSARITAFLSMHSTDSQAQAMAERLVPNPDIAEISVLTRAQALDDFRSIPGFADVVDVLESNPLPPSLIITPVQELEGDEVIQALADDVRALPGVDQVVLDMDWLQRLQATVASVDRMFWIIVLLLSLGLVLIVGNVIHLHIQNRRDEIDIIMLIGGTHAFIRRPFLYTGVWYGLFGSIVAWTVVEIAVIWMSGPLAHLAQLYGESFTVPSLGLTEFLALLAVGTGIGLAGAWLVVARYLKQAEPG